MKLKEQPTSSIYIYCNGVKISKDEFLIMSKNLKQKERDIEYYENYKKSLCQFIITNSCYVANGKYHGRVHLKHADMLNLLKEIQRLEILIYEIKNGKQVQKTTTKRTAKFI
jgi:hypothetical protein|tara:strand:- start:564 stop:899 length:336 start_codon:yes stop_codon:yes gene_type:complete